MLAYLLALSVAGCGNDGKKAILEAGDVSFGGGHLGNGKENPPVPRPDGEEQLDSAEVFEGNGEHTEQLPVCGDGVCQPSETPETCSQDCQKKGEVVAFIFAHKGDELGSLGRIHELTRSGAGVYVFYLSFDDTPLATWYEDSTAKLSVASLGVPSPNIYTYEEYIKWGLVTGSHEVLDRLIQHLGKHKPDSIYVPQLCGGDLESELAHVVGVWAAKRSIKAPKFYEVPARSNYYVLQDPDVAIAKTQPDAFVEQFLKRWKLIPKSTPEIQPVLGEEDTAEIHLASIHIQNKWWQDILHNLPEDRILLLLRMIQSYRQVPDEQDTGKKPYLSSIDNPQGKYIYNEQGYTFDEYRQMAWVIEAFYGTNVRSNPSAIPYYDEPVHVRIKSDFVVDLEVKSFSNEPDVLSFTAAFGPSKQPTQDCQPIEEIQVGSLDFVKVDIQCNANEPIGKHTYYFRVYSAKAAENNEKAKFTELPYVVTIGVK